MLRSNTVTAWLQRDYPEHCRHYYGKYVPGMFTGEREIIICYVEGRSAGIVILKKVAAECKICTLYVEPDYRRQGIATELLQQTFAWLGTTKPLIAIAEKRIDDFAGIIAKYDWHETSFHAVSSRHLLEHVFNGVSN